MISGLKNRDILTEKQQKIRNKELIGLPLTENQKKLIEGRIPIMSGVVPMRNTTKYHDRITTPPSSMKEPNEIDLEEILKEMGYDTEEGGVDDEYDEMEEWLKENDDEYTDSLTIGELKDMIHQMINTNK